MSDRILQHILLKQLKPTFPHIIHPHCYHIHGQSGVKLATHHIRKALLEEKPKFVIRADIKSFYRSIPHHLLIQDIRKIFDDPNVQNMLEEIIKNPIDTPNGCKNPDNGIALRGPLSQLFGAIYLKPLDDAFNNSQVTYIRYNDDILILCQSLRQMQRCKQRLMAILKERRLTLSGKKAYMGPINIGFNFLGVCYPGARPQDNIGALSPDEKAPIQIPALNQAL